MLATIDWIIIGGYLALSVLIGFALRGKASGSKEDYFLSGRTLPWWLIGTSMAATNFAADAPLAIAGIVREEGIAGLWFKWSSLIAAAFAIFVFSKLWRRATVLTDAELVELRYDGASAKWLRLIKAIYFGVLLNAFIMGWVMVAMTKIMEVTVGWPPLQTMLILSTVTLMYTLVSGFWGVVVTDFIQYIISMVASIALAWMSIRHVGGMTALKDKLSILYGKGNHILEFVPTFSNDANELNSVGTISLSTFLVYVLIQWWAQKYADGGGKHIQRMSAAKNENHAMLGTYWFALLTYALQMWPWIVTGVAALVVFPTLGDPELGYPKMILEVMPPGLAGLALLALVSAYMSTIDTHLNLGAAYISNDIYARFIDRSVTDKKLLVISKFAIVVQLLIASGIALNIDSITNTWKFVVAFASGAGAPLVLRWLWWRINAWSEIASMLASGITATLLKLMVPTIEHGMLIVCVVLVSTAFWLAVTLLTKPVGDETLVSFYKSIQPPDVLWGHVSKANVGKTPERGSNTETLVGLFFGLTSLLSFCFGVGVLIFHHRGYGWALLCLGFLMGYCVLKKETRPKKGSLGG